MENTKAFPARDLHATPFSDTFRHGGSKLTSSELGLGSRLFHVRWAMALFLTEIQTAIVVRPSFEQTDAKIVEENNQVSAMQGSIPLVTR